MFIISLIIFAGFMWFNYKPNRDFMSYDEYKQKYGSMLDKW